MTRRPTSLRYDYLLLCKYPGKRSMHELNVIAISYANLHYHYVTALYADGGMTDNPLLTISVLRPRAELPADPPTTGIRPGRVRLVGTSLLPFKIRAGVFSLAVLLQKALPAWWRGQAARPQSTFIRCPDTGGSH